MIMIKAASASLLFPLLLVACSGIPRVHSEEYVTVVEVDSSVNSLNSNLEEVHAAGTMTSQQQERLLSDIEEDFLNDPGVSNHLRLALILVTGDEPVRDRARARILLDETSASTSISASQLGLVQILSQFLEEREATLGKLESCTKQVMQQEQRIKELEQQQKELTSIEQNIQHRDKPVETENGRE